MPRNGSGSYNLPINGWNPAINGVSATPADWQALINDVAAAIQGSVASDGQTPMGGNLAMAGYRLTGAGAPAGAGMSLRWEQLIQGADIPSAATIAIPLEGQLFAVTGSTAITSIAATIAGRLVYLKFDAGIVLTNSANLIMPAGVNVTTVADDIAVFLSVSAGVWKCVSYPRYVKTSPLLGVSAIAAGTADARTAALNPVITAYTDQALYLIRIPAANATATPTLDLGGGAKTVVKGDNLPLIAGDMVGDCVFQYNATLGKLVLINPATSADFNALSGELDFTIIYPNGGTEAAPANVTINSRYVEANPFPGYHIFCVAEVRSGGLWGESKAANINGTSWTGVTATELNNGANVVVQTGNDYLISDANISGSSFGAVGQSATPVPCRVKVWKLKGAI